MRKPSFSVRHYIYLFALVLIVSGGVFYKTFETQIAAALTSVSLNATVNEDVESTADLGSDTGAYQWSFDPDGGGAQPEENLMFVNMPFNSGATQTDFSGNGYSATATNMVSPYGYISGGKVGGAMSFGGGDDYVEFSGASTLNPGASDFTITAWFKTPAAGTSQIIIDKAFSNGVPMYYLALIAGGALDVRLVDNNGSGIADVARGSGLDNNAYHFVAWTVNRATDISKIYVDGIQQGADIDISSVVAAVDPVPNARLGLTNTNQYPFLGIIDEFQMYSQVLSATQIDRLCDIGDSDGDCTNGIGAGQGVGGPSIIDNTQTNIGQVWDLTVTPISGAGVIGTAIDSSNTASIVPMALSSSVGVAENIVSSFVDAPPVSSTVGYQWSLTPAFDLGDSSDGALTISSANQVVNTYGYITSANISSGSSTFTVDSSTGFEIGDEILIIQMQGTNAGTYEFADITNVSGNQISATLTNSYTSGVSGVAGSQVSQIVRVPQYTTVSVNNGASVIASAWNGQKGGIVVFRASGDVSISGSLNVSGQGFRGGDNPNALGEGNRGRDGESTLGLGDATNSTNNGTGGGGGQKQGGCYASGGGGGGYGSAGTNGVNAPQGCAGGTGGSAIGSPGLSDFYFGGGGGGGGRYNSSGGLGGNGGGIINIYADSVTVTGSISSAGSAGGAAGDANNAGGGGGAGGSVLIASNSIDVGNLLVTAGSGAGGGGSQGGGAGGVGRIALHSASVTGVTSPAENLSKLMSLNIPFNTGSTQIDISGNGNSGTVNGSTFKLLSSGDCQVGGCMSFDGTNDYISVPDAASLDFASSFSISLWAKVNGNGADTSKLFYTLISKDSSGDGYVEPFNIYVMKDTFQVNARMGGGGTTLSSVPGTGIGGGGWHHVVLVVDDPNNQLYMYVDGVLAGQAAQSGTIQTNATAMRIGVWQAYNNYFNGSIDEVQIYSRALSGPVTNCTAEPNNQICQLYVDGTNATATDRGGPTEIVPGEHSLNETWQLNAFEFDSAGNVGSAIYVGSATIENPLFISNISGTCFKADTINPCQDDVANSIKVAVNGALQAGKEDTVVDGSWSITAVTVSVGDVITVFISGGEGEGNEAVAITKYVSGNIAGMQLIEEHLTIGSADNQTLTNEDLGQYDNSVSGDEDIFHDVTGSDLVTDIETHNETLMILSDNTFAPGGNVSTSGSWDNNGLFTPGTGTVTFTSTGAETIDSTGATSSDFYNVLLLGTGGQWTLNSPMVVNDMTVTAGTLTGSQNLTVNGGDLICNTVCGTINMTGGTTTVTGSNIGDASVADENGSFTFYDLQLSGAGTTVVHSDIVVSNDLTNGDGTNAHTLDMNTYDNVLDVNRDFIINTNGTLSASNSAVFTVGRNWTNDGVFTSNNGTVTFDSPQTSEITGGNTWYNLKSVTAGKTMLFESAVTQTVNGLLTLRGASGNPIVIDSTVDNTAWILDQQGTESVYYANIDDSGCDAGSTDVTTQSSTVSGDSGVCWISSDLELMQLNGDINGEVEEDTDVIFSFVGSPPATSTVGFQWLVDPDGAGAGAQEKFMGVNIPMNSGSTQIDVSGNDRDASVLGGNVLALEYTLYGGGDQFRYDTFDGVAGLPYSIPGTGDPGTVCLNYDIAWKEDARIGVDFSFLPVYDPPGPLDPTGDLRDTLLPDQNGYSTHPNENLTSVAADGVAGYYSRQIDVSVLEGRQINSFTVSGNHDGSSDPKHAFISNIRMTDCSGSTLLPVYISGPASFNVANNSHPSNTLVARAGAPEFQSSGCKVGGCFDFPGTSGAIQDTIPGVMNTFTMEFWAKPEATRVSTAEQNSNLTISGTNGQRYAIFPPSGGASDAGVGVSVGTNGVSVFEGGDNHMPSLLVHDTSLTDWTHVVVTYDLKRPKLYLNGVLVRTGLKSSRNNFYPGTSLGGDAQQLPVTSFRADTFGPYVGLLDEFRLYPRVLTPQQITQNYNDGLAGDGGPTEIVTQEHAVDEVWTLNAFEITGAGQLTDSAITVDTVTIVAAPTTTYVTVETPANVEVSGNITVQYTCRNTGDVPRDIIVEYFDAGTWHQASLFSSSSGGGVSENRILNATCSSTLPDGISNSFVWDALVDGVGVSSGGDSVQIRITADTAQVGDSVLTDTTESFTVGGVRGRVYNDDGQTPMDTTNCPSPCTVSVSVNGAAAAASVAINTATAEFSFPTLEYNNGDVLTFYLDGETPKAVTVVKASGEAIIGLDLWRNRLIVRQEGDIEVTNAHLDTANNNNDADISAIYTLSGANLTVGSGRGLVVSSGSTYTPGGNITYNSASIRNMGTFNINANAVSGAFGAPFTTSGDVVVTSGSLGVTGTYTQTGGTVDKVNLSVNGMSVTQTAGSIGNMTFTPNAGQNITLLTDLTVTGTLTSSGNVTASAARVIHHSGNFSGTGTFGNSNVTLIAEGSGDQTYSGILSSNLSVDKASGELLIGTGGLSVNNFTLVEGTVNLQGNALGSSPGGNYIIQGGTITGNPGTTVSINQGSFDQDAGTIHSLALTVAAGTIRQDGGTIGDLRFTPNCGQTMTLLTDFTLTGDLSDTGCGNTIGSGSWTIHVEGDMSGDSFSSITLHANGTGEQTFSGNILGTLHVDKPSGILSINANASAPSTTVTQGTFALGAFTFSGGSTYTQTGGAVTATTGKLALGTVVAFSQSGGSIDVLAIDSLGNSTISQTGDATIGNVTFSPRDFRTVTITSPGLTITGNMSVSLPWATTFTANVPSTINLSGNLTVTNGGNGSSFGNNSNLTLRFTGANIQTSSVTGANNYNLTLDKTGGEMKFITAHSYNTGRSFTIANGSTLNLNSFSWGMSGVSFSNNGTVRLRGSETITSLSQDTNSGTWEYVGDGDTAADSYTIGDLGEPLTYYDLTVASTDANDSFASGGVIVVNGTYTHNSGTMNQSFAMSVNGPATFILNDGTYNQTEDLTVTGDIQINGGTFNGSSNVLHSIDVNGGFIQTGGTYVSTASLMTVAGNFDRSDPGAGTFSANGGTVQLDGTLQNVSGSTAFNNFTKTGADTITFDDADVITINGLLTLTGVDALNPLTIRSNPDGLPGTQWEINHQGTESVSFIDLKDAGCTSDPLSTDITVSDSINSGNNDGCWLIAAAVPGQVTGLGATSGNEEVPLTWNTPSDNGSPITDYIVEYSTTSDFSGVVNDVPYSDPLLAPEVTVTGLINGTVYYFRVAAVNGVGTGSYSTIVSETPATVPGAPTGLGATPGNTEVALSWTAPAGNGGSAITDYLIEYSTTSDFSGVVNEFPYTDPLLTPEVTVTGLINGTLYYFRVAAVNVVGTGSSSTIVSETPATVPGAPTGLGATPGNAEVDLSWTAPASNGGSVITGYTIEYGLSGTFGSSVTSATTSKTVIGLVNGSEYSFRVKAENAVGFGDASTSVNATPDTAPAAPDQVTGFNATAGDEEVVLTWTAPAYNGSAIIEYEVNYNTTALFENDDPTPVISNIGDVLTTTVTGLLNGTEYTFEVRAVNGVGAGIYSTEATATPAVLPPAGTSSNINISLAEYLSFSIANAAVGNEPAGDQPFGVGAGVLSLSNQNAHDYEITGEYGTPLYTELGIHTNSSDGFSVTISADNIDSREAVLLRSGGTPGIGSLDQIPDSLSRVADAQGANQALNPSTATGIGFRLVKTGTTVDIYGNDEEAQWGSDDTTNALWASPSLGVAKTIFDTTQFNSNPMTALINWFIGVNVTQRAGTYSGVVVLSILPN